MPSTAGAVTRRRLLHCSPLLTGLPCWQRSAAVDHDLTLLLTPLLLPAQAIKDELLVLSTTQRYRKKYVTTILYKPISSS
jgi:hypothetical protein